MAFKATEQQSEAAVKGQYSVLNQVVFSVGWNAITVALRCRRCYFSNSANRLCLTSEKPQMRPTLFLNMLKYASCAKGCISSRTALGAVFQAASLLTEFSAC